MSEEILHPTATYKTIAINETGVNGVSYIKNEETYPISSPSNAEAVGNPEKFLGLALATCLNATLEAVEKRNQLPHTSKVKVAVYQAPDEKKRGLMFLVDVTVFIPLSADVDARKARAMFDLAESRCPVAKLVGGNENVTFTLVHDWED